MFSQTVVARCRIAIVVITIALMTGACASLQPIDANGPRANEPVYPIGLADPAGRLEAASLAWYQMSQYYGLPGKTEAKLNPYTGTIASLPVDQGTPIALPKVGAEPQQTEEQTRESLRRFIIEWRQLIGAEPDELSLVERTDEPSGIKVARYEQRPFRYPLRGGFGNLTIRFRADRHVVAIASNCIPNADRLQAALGGLTPKVTAEQAANHVKSQPVVTTDEAGRQQTFTLPANAAVEVRQLVVYAQPAPVQTDGLQLHLAWEIDITNGPIKTVYLDAISDQAIAVS